MTAVPESARAATFAGFLGFGDYVMTAGCVSIDIRPRDALSSLPPHAAQQIRDAVSAHGLQLPLVQGGGISLDGTATRTPRPFAIASSPWKAENAGSGAEDAGRAYAARAAPAEADRAGLPGNALEAWLLPVTTFTFEYLITPAGEWPPVTDSSEPAADGDAER